MPGLIPILLLLGAAQGAFLAFALLTSRGGNTRANRYLGCYILVFVCALLDYVLDTTGMTPQYVWLRTLLWPKEFLYGAFLYLYCREMTQPGKPQGIWLRLLLWTPPFVHACLSWPLLWLEPALQYAILLNSDTLTGMYGLWRLLLGDIELLVTIVHLACCLYLCLRLVHRHRQKMVQQFSSMERVSLDWLRNILVGTLLVYVLWLGEEFFSADLLSGAEPLDTALALSMVVLIYGLGWLGLRQPAIFLPPRKARPDNPGNEAGPPPPPATATTDRADKYARSALSAELAAGLMEALQALMRERRPYLSPELSLGELADSLGVSSNYLSQAINQHTGSNFFDFVNGYRIQHTLPLLAGGDGNILDIAMTAGFNSKSAFYTAFRKYQQMTPGQFRKQAAAVPDKPAKKLADSS